MRNLFIPVLFIVILACKKDKNWEYWDNLAAKKVDEIINLSNNYTCADIANLTFQQLPSYCFYSIIVHKNDIQEFNKLVKEYYSYSKKAHDAGKPILIYDMCTENFAIKIACNNNKPHLITSLNIELEDINIEMPKLYDEIINHYNDTLCSNLNDWQGIILYNGENKEAIAIKTTDKSFYQKISLYNQLNSRKLMLEKQQKPQVPNKKIILKCENNQIKAEFE